MIYLVHLFKQQNRFLLAAELYEVGCSADLQNFARSTASIARVESLPQS